MVFAVICSLWILFWTWGKYYNPWLGLIHGLVCPQDLFFSGSSELRAPGSTFQQSRSELTRKWFRKYLLFNYIVHCTSCMYIKYILFSNVASHLKIIGLQCMSICYLYGNRKYLLYLVTFSIYRFIFSFILHRTDQDQQRGVGRRPAEMGWILGKEWWPSFYCLQPRQAIIIWKGLLRIGAVKSRDAGLLA